MRTSLHIDNPNNDKWVIKDIFKGKRNGYFIEAGAGNGKNWSHTFLLEKKFNWTGICVEPNENLFFRLKKNRKCVCSDLVLSEKNETVDFMEVGGNLWGFGGIARYLNETKKQLWKSGTLKRKSAITLRELLEKYNAPKVIDYLALDTEGSEFVILKDFPFDKYVFLAITIEGGECVDLLTRNGYIITKNPYNRLAPWEHYFIHRSIAG
ncbi:MAG: FkbM family methyltransferase [Candidatus Omnitrophota bacterium]